MDRLKKCRFLLILAVVLAIVFAVLFFAPIAGDNKLFRLAMLAGWVPNGVEETGQEMLSVFPNPTSGKVTVKGLPLQEIRVFNILGQLVLCQQGDGLKEKDLELNVTPGLYILQILTPEGQRRLEKIIVH